MLEPTEQLYASITIDIKNSKNLSFQTGKSTKHILLALAHELNERYVPQIRQSDNAYLALPFTIKEGDMLVAFWQANHYRLLPDLYEFLNTYYYSGRFQALLATILAEPELITFHTAIVLNGRLQTPYTGTESLDELNGTLLYTGKYLLNSLRETADPEKQLGDVFDPITNLPFEFAIKVLDSQNDSPTTASINNTASDTLQSLFFLAFSAPFDQKITMVRKIVFFNRHAYRHYYEIAGLLDKHYHIAKYHGASVAVTHRTDKKTLTQLSTKISKILKDADVQTIEHRIINITNIIYAISQGGLTYA